MQQFSPVGFSRVLKEKSSTMFKLTPPQQPKHVSLTDFIRGSKKAKGRRSGSPTSSDLNWASSGRGKKKNALESDDNDGDTCSSIDDKIDRGVVQRQRFSSKSSSPASSSSTSTQAHLLSTIVFLILLFSSVDNDLIPVFLSSLAEHIIFPERFMTPRSSFRFFKLPFFGFIAAVSYLLITLFFSVISKVYHSRLASNISKSFSKMLKQPRQEREERKTTTARPHSSALTSNNNFIEEESDSICSDCGRPWSMHEDWGGKVVSDKDSNATETETDHDDDNHNNDDDDDDDDVKFTRETKKTKLTTKKAASKLISDDDDNINLENDNNDDEDEDGDDERDDLSSSVPSVRRSSRAHTSPARFE